VSGRVIEGAREAREADRGEISRWKPAGSYSCQGHCDKKCKSPTRFIAAGVDAGVVETDGVIADRVVVACNCALLGPPLESRYSSG
jgi:hypothetical protein